MQSSVRSRDGRWTNRRANRGARPKRNLQRDEHVLDDRTTYDYRWVALIDGRDTDLEVITILVNDAWVFSVARGSKQMTIWQDKDEHRGRPIETIGQLKSRLERDPSPIALPHPRSPSNGG